MKRGKIIFLYIISITLIFLDGCLNENLVGINKDNKSNGSITLKISKNTTPSEVQLITAYLTRQDNDTLKTSMNVNNDSLNVLSFENIPIGNWHLTVEAANSEDKIIYMGESDVTIVEDKTIDVYITLTPSSSGEGNINIYINWGNNQNWVDFTGNPFFTVNNNPTLPLALGAHIVLLDNGIYKMWYMCIYNSSKANVWYSESNDGINWQNKFNSPVINWSQPGTWDDYSINVGPVIKENGIYKMYYGGYHNVNEQWSIGLATSTDGIHWEKKSEPVLTPSSNENQLGAWSVINTSGLYYMYYTNRDYPYYSINLAISQDGINWTKYENNPILKAEKDWEGTGIYGPAVIYDQGKFDMIYMNTAGNAFGQAISNDGINWEKENDPIFTLQNVCNNWTNRIAYPDYHKYDNKYWLYYSGYGIKDGSMAVAFKK